MKVSINPTYLCNFRCDFCYLTKEQLSDKKVATLSQIENQLASISSKYEIEHVDLYGGEVALLPEDYLYSLFDIVGKFFKGNINIISNLSRINQAFLDDRVDLSVSYDFEARALHSQVYNNMLMVSKPIAVLILASRDVIEMDVDKMISILNTLRNVVSVEIKPYSTNQSNQHNVSFIDFENFVKRWVDSTVKKEFIFINENRIQDSLAGEYNAFSDNHIYITPDGDMAVLEFDSQDNEFFLKVNSIEDYQQWTKLEKHRVYQNGYCGQCKYLGRCLTEHYREVKDISRSCNGFKTLLDWYDERRHKNNG